MIKTFIAKKDDVQRDWYVIDATDKVLGRMASSIAMILQGKTKPIYTPHVDTGDFVVVLNADKVALTGKKEEQNDYMFFSGFVGNEKHRSVAEMKARQPKFVVEHAVRGMLPKNRLARQMLSKLKVYPGAEHPHEAQNPETITL